MTNQIRHQLDGYLQSVESTMTEHAIKAAMERCQRERFLCEQMEQEMANLVQAQQRLREHLTHFLPRPSEVQPPPLAEQHFRDLPQQWQPRVSNGRY